MTRLLHLLLLLLCPRDRREDVEGDLLERIGTRRAVMPMTRDVLSVLARRDWKS